MKGEPNMKIRKIAATLIIAFAASTLLSASAFAFPSANSAGTQKKSESTQSTQSSDQCATCHGHGTTTCTWCKGTGKMSAAGVSYTCSSCSGTGKAQCLGCNGTGKKREFNTAQPSADTGDTCATCSGAGNTSCNWCKGTGQMSAGGTSYTCVTCGGTGSVQCLGCGGTGKKRELKSEVPATAPSGVTVNPSTSFDPSAYNTQTGYGTMCPICNGAGQRVCQSCSGNGFTETMKSSANYGYGSSSYWTKKSCAACHSSGKVPCTYCGGDGVR